MKTDAIDFNHLNHLYRNALSAWVNELFAEDDVVLFDTRLAEDQDWFSDQVNEFWGYLTHADWCLLIEVFHHEDGPHILDIRRPNSSLRRGSTPQIELSMKYGTLISINYFAEDSHYGFTMEVADANPQSKFTSLCRATRNWDTLEGCLQEIARIQRLNPAHRISVYDATTTLKLTAVPATGIDVSPLEKPVGRYTEARTVEHRNTISIISPYLEKHRPQHQECMDDIPINPQLRSGFDNTAHRDRDPMELQDWLDRPFIVTETWDSIEKRAREHRAECLQNRPWEAEDSEDDFEEQLLQQKARWLKRFPTSTRYQIRCLDCGVPDRSSSWGYFPAMVAAITLARRRPEHWHELKKVRNLSYLNTEETDPRS